MHSIWLVPQKPVYDELTKIIKNLAEKYDGPIFEVHSTLLGDIPKTLPEIETGLKKLAKEAKTLDLSLGEVSFSTTYFQSVFVRVNINAHLAELNIKAKEIFDMPNSVFMPHMSLLYGYHKMKVREEAAKSVKLPPLTFKINKFTVIPATNDPNDWQHVATIPFAK